MNDYEMLERLEREMVAALERNDADALSAIWDDEFVFTDPHGQTISAAECQNNLRSGKLRIVRAKIDDLTVRVFEDTGIVVGIVTLEGHAGARRYDGAYSFIDVYSRRNGRWRVVLSSGDRVKPFVV